MEQKKLHIPTLSNLKFGNIFSGSCKNFNFKIFPNCDEGKMKIAIWKGKNCFEKSDIYLMLNISEIWKASFPFTF